MALHFAQLQSLVPKQSQVDCAAATLNGCRHQEPMAAFDHEKVKAGCTVHKYATVAPCTLQWSVSQIVSQCKQAYMYVHNRYKSVENWVLLRKPILV